MGTAERDLGKQVAGFATLSDRSGSRFHVPTVIVVLVHQSGVCLRGCSKVTGIIGVFSKAKSQTYVLQFVRQVSVQSFIY